MSYESVTHFWLCGMQGKEDYGRQTVCKGCALMTTWKPHRCCCRCCRGDCGGVPALLNAKAGCSQRVGQIFFLDIAVGAEIAQIMAMCSILNPSQDRVGKITTPFIAILNLHIICNANFTATWAGLDSKNSGATALQRDR